MYPTYIPILKAKKGEFDALLNIQDNNLSRAVVPLFELPRSIRKSLENLPNKIEVHLSELAGKIAELRNEKEAFLDITSWSPDATLETGEHILTYTVNKLKLLSVKVIPVIGYDRWDDTIYQNALIDTCSSNSQVEGSIRLESEAFDDIDDPEYFISRLRHIMSTLGLKGTNCSLLIDFRDVSQKSIDELQEYVQRILKLVRPLNFKYAAIFGSSMPPSINLAVKEKNTTGSVLRREMILWRSLIDTKLGISIVFGDYGVRSPLSNEDIIAPDTNGKIRYTIDDKFFIARGRSQRIEDKGCQNHRLSKQIVDSEHYRGEPFSWGDKYISDCSKFSVGPGNPTTWIAVDTNHHIHAVVSQVSTVQRAATQPHQTVNI